MHPRTSEVLTYFAAQHAVLEQAIAAVPSTYHRRRPAPDRWSVAEVVAHVTLVQRRVIRALRGQLEAARARGLGPERETSPIAPTFPLDRVLDRTERIDAMEKVLPPADADVTSAWAALLEENEALRAMITAADGLALGEVLAPNPVLGDLNLYQWVEFLGAHEARHAGQISEIAQTLGARTEAVEKR